MVIYPGISASAVDYALGIENGTLWRSVPTTTQTHRWYGGTTTMMTLTNNNLSVTGDVNSNSDIKLKTNIKTLTNSLDKVLKIRGVEFDRIDLEGRHQIGVIAQEIEEIVPELVSEINGIKSVSYGNISALLIEAIKEQQNQINNLKTQIENPLK
jgi:hypothetical protein